MTPVGGEDAVADEAMRVAGHDRLLAELSGHRERGRQHVRRGLGAAHDLQKFHDICRREEVQADHVGRPRCRAGDFVEIEIGRVAGQHRAGPGYGIQAAKNVRLHLDRLESRFDDQVRLCENVPIVPGHDAAEPLVGQ